MMSRSRALPWTVVTILVVLCAGCTAVKQCAYEGFDRDEWQKPEQVIGALDIQAGSHIADLGSGSGYFTFRLAKAVGPKGKVYAVDVDSEMNKLIAERAKREGYENVEVILAQHDDPSLPGTGVALIFTSNTYHHLQDQASYFSKAARYLRPHGRVAVIEFNGEGWFQSLGGHWTSSDEIERDMKQAGYSLQRKLDFLPKQNFLIFGRTTE